MGLRDHLKQRQRGLGPGGWYCPCCALRRSQRPAWVRAKKRSDRQKARRDIATEVAGGAGA